MEYQQMLFIQVLGLPGTLHRDVMKELKFVDVGEGITEGHIRKWLVKDGEAVKEDQPVLQIETDKAIVNLPAPVSGIVKINAPEDSIVKVGDTIAYFGSADELKEIKSQPKQEAAPAQQVQKEMKKQEVPQKKVEEILATPSVRKLA